MKRLLLTLFVVFVAFQSSNAQFHLSLAPVTGLNFNIATGSDVKETTNGFGFVIGGKVDMDFSPTIGLMANVLFYDNRSVSSSTTGTVQGISYTIDNSYSISYFEIEPLLKVSIPKSMFYFFVGPSFGINMESTNESDLSSSNGQVTFQDGSTKQKTTVKDMNARFELKLGSGMNINVSNDIVIAPELSFGYGLTKVQSDIEARILTIQALVGVKFRLM